jgi:hypothetical protein
MALEDYMESEVAIAVAATAAIFSPPVRRVLRRGAVYGLAGLMMAGDAIATAARGVATGAQQAAATATSAVQEAGGQAHEAVTGTQSSATHVPVVAEDGGRGKGKGGGV